MRKSNFRVINLLVLSLILVLSIVNPVLADGGPHEEVNKVDGYRVKLIFVEGDVLLGRNKLKIEIKDVFDQAVGNATVTVIAELYPETSENSAKDMNVGMGNASAQKDTSTNASIRTVQAEMKAGQIIGEYEGEVNLEETGRWMIQVGFLILSRKRVAEFPMDLYGVPNSWIILGSFLAINVGIIALAASKRRKCINTLALEETR